MLLSSSHSFHSDVKNESKYRGVTLIRHTMKRLERVESDGQFAINHMRLTYILEGKHLLDNEQQHGFLLKWWLP